MATKSKTAMMAASCAHCAHEGSGPCRAKLPTAFADTAIASTVSVVRVMRSPRNARVRIQTVATRNARLDSVFAG